ncbi:hypothetical protein BHYA_0294g00110 [Botrytis hyacinthi]|uniref:Uncharacterized protein n=1 Tax=Botrytis hyacinthi TaxID=278943 RepID=A0A4Z1G6X3_9HELO|nr:hypothetical protein BHYA_0294g00110 [Botrytis hyacinthi]
MSLQAYCDKAPMQIPMLKLMHHSAFSWEEGSIEQRGFTKEEMLSLQVVEAVTKKAARLFGIDLGTPSTLLHGAGLTLSISFADKIAGAHIYRRPTEEKESRGIFLKDAAVDGSEAEMRIKSRLTCVKLRTRYRKSSSKFKNTDVSSNERAEKGTDKRNLKPPKPSKNDDTWCTWFRGPEYTNEVEWPTFSLLEVITDGYMEQNQMPRENNEECNSAVPPKYASSKCLEQVSTDQNFLSSPEQGIRAPYPIHELDRI